MFFFWNSWFFFRGWLTITDGCLHTHTHKTLHLSDVFIFVGNLHYVWQFVLYEFVVEFFFLSFFIKFYLNIMYFFFTGNIFIVVWVFIYRRYKCVPCISNMYWKPLQWSQHCGKTQTSWKGKTEFEYLIFVPACQHSLNNDSLKNVLNEYFFF